MWRVRRKSVVRDYLIMHDYQDKFLGIQNTMPQILDKILTWKKMEVVRSLKSLNFEALPFS